MKTKFLFVLFSGLLFFPHAYAQDNNSGTTVSEQCLVNISLFNESAKNKQYADALKPWKAAYAECPGANKAIYSRGREILQWQISQAKDDASYKADFDELMGMYDNRIKYFGNDERYPTPWILGLKALDYITYSKGDNLKKPAYQWLEQSIDGLGESSELEVLRQFVILSDGIYKADNSTASKYIADYLKVKEILEKKAANPQDKNAEIAGQISQGLDVVFAQSGAADCKKLDVIYQSQLKDNATNLDFLNKVVGFYKRVHCTESEVYFAASVDVYKIQPTEESANGCAEMSYKKGDYQKAIAFYEDATKLSTDNMAKADYLYKIAQIYYTELNNFPKSREYARKALEFNPKNGESYLLIGILYAKTKGLYDDPVLAKTVYWVAVDKFYKAKQVDNDPKTIEDADKLIRTYSAYFPSKEDVFFQPLLQSGKSFTVGGWIGETTTCR